MITVHLLNVSIREFHDKDGKENVRSYDADSDYDSDGCDELRNDGWNRIE